MRQTISVSSITILTLASMLSLSLPAFGLPRYAVEAVEFDRAYGSYPYAANENGQVLIYSGVHDWVWSTGGHIRQIQPPDPNMQARFLAPDSSVYVVWGVGEPNMARIRPDGAFEPLRPAQTPLFPVYDILLEISSIAPDGRALSHVTSIDSRYNLQVSWQADSIDPDLRLIQTPDDWGRMIETSTNSSDMGTGRYQSQVLDSTVPALRVGDTVRLLDRTDYTRGYASKISENGRWIAGTLLSETLTGYDSVAVRWDREVLAFLSPLPGYATAFTNSINSDGIAVGRSEQGTWPLDLAPTIWDEQGIPHNLLDLLETDKEVYPETPISIDERGRILARGYELIDGLWYDKAFFLTPIPEPAMVGLIAMLGVGLRRVR